MKNILLLVIVLLFPLATYAAEDQNSTNLDLGEIDGRIRLYHVFYPAYVKSGRTDDYSIDGSTIGGHIRYTSPSFAGIGLTTAGYFAMGTGLNDTDDNNTIMAAGRFFTKDYSFKAVLGELNVHYKGKNHFVQAGRFKLNTPLTNAIYTYMPNMFEAALYTNSSLDSTKITIAQVDKMAYGTRAPVEFGMIGEVTGTGGTTQSGLETRGEFIDIEDQTVGIKGNTQKTNGLTVFGLTNDSLENITLRVWDFYAHDIINMLYLDVKYKTKKVPYTFAAQYLRVDSVGNNLASGWLDGGDAYLLGAKGTYRYKKAFVYLGLNHSGDARILNPWSGDPAYTSSFFSKNAYRANVNAYKLGFNYDMLDNLKLITSYAGYGQSTTRGFFAPSTGATMDSPKGDAMEGAFLLSYKPMKELHILGGLIYKTSEYFVAGEQVKILDVDLLVTYSF